MAAEVVYSSTTGPDALQGRLFEGVKFWISAKVPQRTRFINDVKANGGEILPLEKHADIMIVDHARKEAPPGTHSYTYIEKSIRSGALEDLNDHAVGPAPGTVRSVGSIVQPPKTTRKKYTQEDERILWDWVNTNPQKGGGTDGNEIYKQLEAKHPQHPWQSWRDHWVKTMKGKARPIYPPNNAPPTPPSEMQTTEAGPARRAVVDGKAAEDDFDKFSKQDADTLLQQAQHILDLPAESIADAWSRWASEMDVENKHTAEEWQAFWEHKVRPSYLRRQQRRTREAGAEQGNFPGSSALMGQEQSKATSPPRSRENRHVPRRSPSYHPESPKLPSAKPPVPRPTIEVRINATPPQKTMTAISPLGNSILKRKRLLSEEVPSSSPPQIKQSPLPNRSIQRRKEIASTPDVSPQRRPAKKKHEELFLEHEFEAETDEILRNSEEGVNSPLGQQPSESLSEPDRTLRGSTQALFRESTPSLGLEVALPEGGWSSDEDADNADKSESDSQYDSAHERPAVPDTQAILDSKTQIPDLAVPDLDEWPATHPPSSPPTIMPSSPGAESESSSAQQAQLDAEIDRLITDRTALGFTAEQVVIVLNSTCTDIQLAEQVLEQMGPQQGEIRLPEDVKGVWTDRDDKDLYSSDARKVSRIEKKHGPDKFNARYEWLQLMAQEEDEGNEQ